jgi:hypothetical protein
MRGAALVLAAALALLGSAPATAQYYGGIPTRIILDGCYNPNLVHRSRRVISIDPYIDQAMEKYLGVARGSGKLDKVFTGTREHRLMLIDGVQVDPRNARDPWTSRVARLEPAGSIQSNDDFNAHGKWRALAADGSLVGTYDAYLRAGVGGFHIRQLKLVSAGSTIPPDELKPFCIDPGDIEKWQEKKAQREAEKAAKRAENQ